jgi:hypothetical protein
MSREENRNKGWLARAFASGAIKAIVHHIFVVYVIPLGTPLVVAYIGHLEGYPWFIILVGSSLAFSGVTTGLVRLDDWIERRRVKGKLQFAQISVGRDINSQGIFVGINLINKSAIPIDMTFTEVRTRVGNQVPLDTKFNNSELTIPPSGIGWLNDHAINLANIPKPGTLEGFAEFRIKYGRPGNLKHDLTIKKAIVVRFNSDGFLEAVSWNDAM